MSSWMQDSVREFHEHMGQPAPEKLDIEGVRMELRLKLIMEEALEVVQAAGYSVTVTAAHNAYFRKLGEPDWVEVVDGLCDLAYVTFGFAVEAGFSLGPFFCEVHRSNMTKLDKETGKPIIRESDGKVLKPETWEPPRIKYLWDRLVSRSK